jgi:3-deoxy-manno-octulosonate cytidylyltransferase (CMP-KDO synthetase)
MKSIGIIPARYDSSRFPGKPLADINGKPMIQRVYEQAKKAGSLSAVYVATDDERIFNAVKQFGGSVLMTSTAHPSGTDRCNEVAKLLSGEGQLFEVVVNIQGDEPYIHPDQINLVVSCFSDPETGIATLACKISAAEDLFNSSVNKVVLDKAGNALYFSRNPIPYQQHADREDWLKNHVYYKHIGIYAYRASVLSKISDLEPSSLEKAESLEQLRWLENGYRIRVVETVHESRAVDRPDDLAKFTNMF